MARKRLITISACQRGNVPASAVPVATRSYEPWFVPVDRNDLVVSGFHLGRRLDWEDTGRRELVWVDVQEESGEWYLSVWRCGTTKPEHVGEWDLGYRIAGLQSVPDEVMELQAIAVH